MTLREASAHFIEAGRALGRVEQCKSVQSQLDEILAELPTEYADLAVRLRDLKQRNGHILTVSEATAKAAQDAAARLMHQLEHPGARLARRLVQAVRAARNAWKLSAR